MSYQTVEVELDGGHVQPCGEEKLPAKARALLTILSEAPTQATPAAGSSLAELVNDLAGIGRGQYIDLSTNRAHLDDLGR
jgi:hypothetical protein